MGMATKLIEWIDARAADMLERPRTWASTPEALEFQLLTLLDIRAIELGQEPLGPGDKPYKNVFLFTQVDGVYVSEHFRKHEVSDPEFLRTLRGGWDLMIRRQNTPDGVV